MSMFGKEASAPGSQAEFDNWDMSSFDRLSNEGIAAAGEGDAYDWDYMGTLLGAQGGGGQRSRAQQMQGSQMQAPSSIGVLQGLMGMVGQPQQRPRPGTPYQNRYVSGLMNV